MDKFLTACIFITLFIFVSFSAVYFFQGKIITRQKLDITRLTIKLEQDKKKYQRIVLDEVRRCGKN
jgi:hypothetical protein